jgi:hypothetical protein
MSKFAALILLLIPLIATAQCGFALDGATMTIVVGKDTNTCFSSDGFRKAFKADMSEALEQDDPRVRTGKKSIDDRNVRGTKLWAIAERNHQANPGGSYFGQKR